MEWSKVKNIVILILVTVNLFLLILLGYREGQASQYLAQTRSEAVQVLEKNGIAVHLGALPKEPALQQLRLERDAKGEAAVAAALLGDGVEQLPGAAGYESAWGSAFFHSDGSFDFHFEADVWPLHGEEPVRHGLAQLKKLGMEGELVANDVAAGKGVLTLRQLWQGQPVFNCEVRLTYEAGALRSVEGRRLAGVPTPEGGQAMSVATALIRFLREVTEAGYVCSEMTGLAAGYEVTSAPPGGGVFRMAPVWRVNTNLGLFDLDGITGTMRSVTPLAPSP